MAFKIKGKKEKEKEPEPQVQLVSLSERAVMALRPHAGKLLVVIVGAGLALGGYSIYGHFQDKARAEATYVYDKAVQVLLRPVEQVPETLQLGAPDEAKFKTLKERTEAAQTALAKVVAEEGDTQVGAQASLLVAATNYDAGKLDESIQAYQKYIAAAKDPGFRALAQEGLGQAYEAKALGQSDAAARNAGLDQALGAYADIDRAATGPFAGLSLYHQGRIQALKGDAAKATELYKKALEKPLLAPLKQDIQSRLALVEKKQ